MHIRTTRLLNDQVFLAIDLNKDDRIEESEFIAFYKTFTKKIGETEDVKEEPLFSEEDLSRLFVHLDREEEGFLSKKDFTTMTRRYMRAVKETVVTDGVSIQSEIVRRLAEQEVVEVLHGPRKEESVDVMRIRVKSVSKACEGWVTAVGNQGTVFLVDGGSTYKVVKDTILTEEFTLESTSEETRKLKDTTRKLKPGEVVEVLEWPREEEVSGLMRMKVRAKSDGASGWATEKGNTGIVFLEVI